MSTAELETEVPTATPVFSHWEEAIAYLEQAQKVGKTTTESLYLLAMCYKRLGKKKEAFETLRKIKDPDANIITQIGLIAFRDGQYADAEQTFLRATEMDPEYYPAHYNLFLSRLFLGKLNLSSDDINNLANLAKEAEETAFLRAVGAMIRCAEAEYSETNGESQKEKPAAKKEDWELLAGVSEEIESRILYLLKSVGKLDTIYPLIRALARGRNKSSEVQRIYLEVVLLKAKSLHDRCKWEEASKLLEPLTRFMETVGSAPSSVSQEMRLAFLNLQGCFATMLQEYEKALRCFTSALKLVPHDPWLHQNLALTYELMGRMDQADKHWGSFFDLLNTNTPAPPIPNYLETLAYTSLHRMAETYNRMEQWGSALGYLQRAYRLRPRDHDTLDKLFQLYIQIRRIDDARRMLRNMRELRPNDPQLDLYELDLREIRSLEDMDRILSDLQQIINKYPGDARVEDRAVQFVGNFVPLIGRKCDQLSQKLAHIVDQVRGLPNYKINWPVVHDEMSYMRKEFQNLRKIANKCLSSVQHDEHRRVIRDLIALIEGKIDICISMGG